MMKRSQWCNDDHYEATVSIMKLNMNPWRSGWSNDISMNSWQQGLVYIYQDEAMLIRTKPWLSGKSPDYEDQVMRISCVVLPSSCPSHDSPKQPGVVGHGHQHQEVGEGHLDQVQQGLERSKGWAVRNWILTSPFYLTETENITWRKCVLDNMLVWSTFMALLFLLGGWGW